MPGGAWEERKMLKARGGGLLGCVSPETLYDLQLQLGETGQGGHSKAIWQASDPQRFQKDEERRGPLSGPGVPSGHGSLQAGPWLSAVDLLSKPWPVLSLSYPCRVV